MIRRQFNHPHVLWQRTDHDGEMPNDAIAACIDNGGTILIQQGSAEIVLSKASVNDLCKLLKQLASKSE